MFIVSLYSQYELETFWASILSGTVVALICFSVFQCFFIEVGVITDVAFLSLYVIFILRNAILDSVSPVTSMNLE